MKIQDHSRPDLAHPCIQILLVDDHPAVRQGLALLLAPEGMETCAEAAGRIEALACAQECRPDLAIVDLSLDGEDGTSLIVELRTRNIPVLVYSMHSDPRHVQSAIAAGALGYVSKRELHDVLVRAIRDTAAGRRFVSPLAAAALADNLGEAPAGDATQLLSPHEHKVYEMLGQGADTFEIASVFNISNHTVESYYARILVKLNLNGMHELRRHAIAHFQKQPE